jgi:photosystem II stability/assembly factor-like uncharacterized protein
MFRLAFFTLLTGVSLSALSQEKMVAGEYFGDLKARHIGPALMSGRVSDVELHPKNSNIVLIGSAGGGVWKSQDGGVRFTSIFDGYCQSIGVVTIDPNDPDNTYWVGTGETWTRNSVSVGDGIYKTNDGGKNWTKMGLEKTDRIASIQIHPKNSNVIYVAALGALWGNSDDRGVYKTEDGGKTWNKILFVNNTTGCSELVMDPSNPDVLYAALWEFRRTAHSFNSGGLNSAIYKSTDGGKTWQKLQNGLPKGKLGRIAVTVAPSNPQIVYAVMEAEKKEEKGLYRSDDGGANWKFLNGDFALTVRPFYFSRITVDPKNPEIVTKAGLFGSISRDGGKTFKNLGSMHSDIHDIVFDHANSSKMFAATDGGLYRSLDGGSSLEIVENLPLSQFYHVSVDNRTPFYVYGGLQDNNSWFGPSASPGGVESRDWELVGQGDGFRVYPHPTDPNVVYSEMQGAEAIWRFDVAKQQLKVVKPYPVDGDPKLRFNWNAAITTSKHQPNRLYAGSQFVHISEDRGDSWKKISPDLTTNDKTKQNQEESGGLSADNSGAENHCTIFTIAESPLTDQVIWVGTDDGNVQLTQDGGKNWTNLTKNIVGLPANTWCFHIEASVHGKEIAYAVFDGHAKNDYQPYIYKTTDFGKTWKSISTSDIGSFVRNIQEDYKNQNLLFIGAENGLHITLDGGANWSPFTNNFPKVAIHYLELHPEKNSLVAATHGRGIIILDDISPLRNISESLLKSSLTFFDTKPFTISEKSNFGGTASENQFVGDNPSSNAKINYFLPKRHTFGKMTAEIVDMNGNLVSKLEAGKQKGINTIEWGFNALAPKVAKGKGFSVAGAPTVKAGKYKVKITKGSEVFEKEIEVQYDPNSTFTLSERTEQQRVTKELFDFVQDLAYFVYQIDQWDEKVEEFKKKNSAPNKTIDKLSTELDALRDKLVVTKGDNYVGAGEPQLREKLNDIYGTISSYYGAPSSTQLENIASLKKQFENTKSEFEKIKSGNLKSFEKILEKNTTVQKPVIVGFDEFLKL